MPIHPPSLRRAAGAACCAALLSLTLACDSNPATPTPLAATATTAPTLAPPTAPAPTETVAIATNTAAPPTLAPTATTPPAPPPTDTAPPAAPATVTAAPTAVPATDTAAPVEATATTVPVAPTTAPATDTPAPAVEATDTSAAQATATILQIPGRVAGDLSQVIKVPPGQHEVAITFDAGAGAGYVPSILRTLAAHQTHITFFTTGQWAEQNPDYLRMIVAAGDEIGNHSYDHPSFPKLTDAQMTNELTRTETIVQATAGVSTKPYWRPPFGDETGHVLTVARGLGYRSIFWTWDSLDSVGQPKTKDFLVKRVLGASVQLDGAIILMHVGNETSAEALPEILDGLAAKGLRVVTISELLTP